MTTQLIPVFAGELSGAPVQLVDATLLHKFLEVTTKFADWITRRIEEYSFIENQDFLLLKFEKQSGRGGHNKIDYHITLDMAKELSMVERNEKGRQIRRYFLDMERQAQLTNNPCQLSPPKTKKALPGCLTEATQDEIKQLIQSRAATLPRERQAGFIIAMWSALSTHFGVKKQPGDKTPAYKYIPEGMRMECLSLIARLSVDNLVTLTTEELSERVKALEGEVLPRREPQQHNAVTISINGGLRLMTVVFEGKVDKMARYLVQVEQNYATIHALEMEAIALTEDKWIEYMVKEKDYLVIKKTEVLNKLQS